MARPNPYQCPICYDSIKKPVMLKACEHVFCTDCIDQWVEAKQRRKATCPFCREKIKLNTAPFIRVQPKYDTVKIPMAQDSTSISSSQESRLTSLKEELAAKTNELAQLEAENHAYEQEQQMELESLDQKIESSKNEVKMFKDKFTKETRKMEKLLEKMPFTSIFFEKICDEVNKDPRKLNETSLYDEIHSAWLIARNHFESRNKMLEDIAKIKREADSVKRRNTKICLSLKQYGAEEISQFVSNETFRKLCEIMKWKYDDHVKAPAPALQFNCPKEQQPSNMSSSNASKRPFSCFPMSRPAKISKPSHFKNDQFDSLDVDDMF